MTPSAFLSVILILMNLIAAILAFTLRDSSPLSLGIILLNVFAAIVSMVLMILNKKEMARIKTTTNAAAHSMFGGV